MAVIGLKPLGVGGVPATGGVVRGPSSDSVQRRRATHDPDRRIGRPTWGLVYPSMLFEGDHDAVGHGSPFPKGEFE
jgi:hypothetical protein